MKATIFRDLGSISSTCLLTAFTLADPKSAKSSLIWLSFLRLKLSVKCSWNWPQGSGIRDDLHVRLFLMKILQLIIQKHFYHFHFARFFNIILFPSLFQRKRERKKLWKSNHSRNKVSFDVCFRIFKAFWSFIFLHFFFALILRCLKAGISNMRSVWCVCSARVII